MSANLQSKAFTDDTIAREVMEAMLWPNGPICPHCGCTGKIGTVEGPSARAGLYYCGDCKEQFTVTVGTIFERSKVPLSKWLMAIHFMACGKKGTSAHQLHRMLGVTYRTAWFMEHRIREAMRSNEAPPMGGDGTPVEADETFFGRKTGAEVKQGYAHKNAILTLVERGGSVRSFHIGGVAKAHLVPILRANIDREAHLMTDEAGHYIRVGKKFAAHGVVDHSREEWAYRDRVTGTITTVNTAEGFFSIFKRGMIGVYRTAASSIFTAISRNSISDTAIVPNSGSLMRCAPRRSFKARRANALCIDGLTRSRSPNRRKWPM